MRRQAKALLVPLLWLLVTGGFALDRGLDGRTMLAMLWAFAAGVLLIEWWDSPKEQDDE